MIRLTALLAVLLNATVPAAAATCLWSGVSGSWDDSAQWSCGSVPDAGDQVTIPSGTVTLGTAHTVSSVAVGGTATLQVNLPGSLTITSGLELAGTLAGSGTVSVTGGDSEWTGGTMSGSGATLLAAGAALEVNGGGLKTLDQRTLSNSGEIVWLDGNFSIRDGASFVNAAGGVLDVRGNVQFDQQCCDAPVVFTNHGLLRRTVGTGTVKNTIEEFLNTGAIQVLSGSFRPRTFTNDGGTLEAGPAGEIVLDSSGEFDLLDGTVLQGAGKIEMLNGTMTVSGEVTAKTLLIKSGIVNGTGTLVVSSGSTVRWHSGTMTGSGTTLVEAGGILLLATTGNKITAGRTFDNRGTIQWTGGNWSVHDGATIDNRGLLSLESDDRLHQDCCPGAITFLNRGTLRKSGTTGTSTISAGPLDSSTGTIEVRRGILDVSVPLALTSASTLRFELSGLAPGTDYGRLNVGPSPSLAGAEIDAFSLPWIPPAGSVFTVVTGTYSSHFSNVNVGLAPGAFVDVTYPASDRVDLVAGHAGTLSLASSAVTVAEDDGPLTMTVDRANGTDGSVTVTWTVTAVTATSADYGTSSGTLSIPDGSDSGTFNVPITDDSLDENDETFAVTLSNPTAYALLGTPSSATVTIGDDDPPPAIGFTSARSSGLEGDTVTVKAVLSAASSLDVTVPIAIAAASTAQPADYQTPTLSISITAGSLTGSLAAKTTDDSLDEDDQTVVLVMGSPVNATAGSTTTHTVTIVDDDATPRIWFATPFQASVTESGRLEVVIDVSNASERVIKIPFGVAGTAVMPDDYQITGTPLTLAPGQTRGGLSISIEEDDDDEPSESVVITLGAPVNATLGPVTVHTAMIADDDGVMESPVMMISAPAREEGDTGTTPFRFVLSIVPPAAESVTLAYQTGGTTADAGQDFTEESGSVTFAAGETTRQIVVGVMGDTSVEPDEQFTLSVSVLAGIVGVPDPVSTATIVNDDSDGRPSVDLVLELDAPASVVRGEEIAVTATVRNRGARIASGVHLDFSTDGLIPMQQPAHRLAAIEGPVSCEGLACTLEDLTGGASAEVILRLSLPVATDASVVSVTATVSSDRSDGNQADNTVTATMQIACSVPIGPAASAVASVQTGIAFALGWTSEGGVDHYEVQESPTPDFAAAITTIASDNSTMISKEVEQMTAAFFHVRGVAACSGTAGAWSNIVEVRFRPLLPPLVINAGPPPFVAPFGTTELLVQSILIGPPPSGSAAKAQTTFAESQFDFTVGTDRPWLTVDREAGTMPAEGTLLEVTIDPATLPAGSSTGTINVAIGAASTSRITSTTTVAIPISVTLVTPVSPLARELPPPENTLVIPAVANARGIASDWRSDVRILNPTFAASEYDMTFVPSRADASHLATSTRFPVAAGETVALDDVLNTWFAIGTFDESALGFLEIRPVADAVAVAASRTYNISGLATLGQFIPAIPFTKFVGASDIGKVLSLQQLRQSDGYRTNIGLVEGAGLGADLMIHFFDPLGGSLGSVPVTLAAGQHVQLDGLLAMSGASVADARAEIEIVSGGGKVTAYASVIDGESGDPMLVASTQTSRTSSQSIIPGIANLVTGGHHWRSDVRLYNPAGIPALTTLSYYPLGATAPEQSTTITLGAGEVRSLDDVLPAVFGTAQSAGALHVHSDHSVPLTATARTYDVQPGGTFGQFIPAVTASDAAGIDSAPLRILYAEESIRRRTNLGLVELTGNPVRVEIEATAPDAKISARTEMDLGANEFRQLSSILRAFGIEATYNATITVRAVGGDGRVAAYASSIDNLTGDPTYIPAQ